MPGWTNIETMLSSKRACFTCFILINVWNRKKFTQCTKKIFKVYRKNTQSIKKAVQDKKKSTQGINKDN